MKSSWIRLLCLAGVLAVIAASAAALAAPDPNRMDTTRCSKWLKKNTCTITCEDSVYTIGFCRDDTTGTESPISFPCCCCTEGAEHRSFVGG
jgi:hypothetical protein